jgi:hypothetical protein
MANLVGIVTKASSLLNKKRSYKTVTPFFNMSPQVRHRGQALGVFAALRAILVRRGGFLPVCLPEAFAAWRLCAPYSFFLFSSRKIAEEQRNCGPLGLTAEGRKTLTAWLVRRSG